jgi:hypothetical protein
METKTFEDDFQQLYKRLKSRKPFAFSKYADGEFYILVNKPLLIHGDKWTFEPDKHSKERELLMDSFIYNHPQYIIGISCPCCQPMEDVRWMRDNTRTDKLTWANLFVNSNYIHFKEKFIPEFNKWEGTVNVIASEKGSSSDLPFKCDNYIPINKTAWQLPYITELIDKGKQISETENDQLFLFSGGPVGNIMAHQLHMNNPNNTYIDIGSTINPWVLKENNRGYLQKTPNLNKTCIW